MLTRTEVRGPGLRRPSGAWAVVAAAVAFAIAPGATGARDSADALFIVNGNDYAAMLRAEAAIEAAGGEVHLLFPNRVMLGHIAPADAAFLNDHRDLAGVHFSAVAVADQLGRANADERAAVEFWNEALRTIRLNELDEFDHLDHPELGGDAREAPPSHPSFANRRLEFPDRTPVMGGKIVQTIFFVESNGQVDPNTENWGRDWKVVRKEAIAGLRFWTDNAPPEAKLKFVIKTKKPKKSKTGYEPINRTSNDEGLWIGELMDRQGFPAARIGAGATYFDQVRAFNGRQAERFKADGGGASEFVVNSKNDADGRFVDEFFGYAYLGGPFTVMTYDNNGWGVERFDRVQAHENGHLTGRALDEYAGSGCSCTQTSPNGALNGNCFICSDTSCMMKNNTPPLCSFTRAQLGWEE